MGLEKLDTRLGFLVGRGENAVFPVLVVVKKPVAGEALEILLKIGASEEAIKSGRFVFAASLPTEEIVSLAGKEWVKKLILKREI